MGFRPTNRVYSGKSKENLRWAAGGGQTKPWVELTPWKDTVHSTLLGLKQPLTVQWRCGGD